MAGRSDGSVIKALFSPNKVDPPHQEKKKNKSLCEKNAPPPDQKEKSTQKNPSPDKNAPTNSPSKNEKEKEKEKNENCWTAPPKIQIDVDDLLQRAKAIFSEVQEHGFMFNLEEVRQDQKKKRTVSVFLVDKRSRKIVKPAKDMVLRQISSLGVKAQAIIAGTSYAFWDILLSTIDEAVALTKKH